MMGCITTCGKQQGTFSGISMGCIISCWYVGLNPTTRNLGDTRTMACQWIPKRNDIICSNRQPKSSKKRLQLASNLVFQHSLPFIRPTARMQDPWQRPSHSPLKMKPGSVLVSMLHRAYRNEARMHTGVLQGTKKCWSVRSVLSPGSPLRCGAQVYHCATCRQTLLKSVTDYLAAYRDALGRQH